MKKKILCLICILVLLLSSSCGGKPLGEYSVGDYSIDLPASDVSDESVEASFSPEVPDIPDVEDGESELEILTVSGTENCWKTDGSVLTFSSLDADTVCSVSGKWAGSIVIDTGDDYEFELELCGVTVSSRTSSPIVSLAGADVTLTAKKGYENFVCDRRALSENEETTAAIFASGDLTVGGKGSLSVVSDNYGGIRTKDDLKLKNLTLSVNSSDTSLRGSDGVKAENCTFTLISVFGDGIKTSNSGISSKGNRKGSVKLENCVSHIYAACDGIDAAYNVEIGENAALDVYTDKYSPYSGEVTATDDDGRTPPSPGPEGGGRGGPGGPGGGPGGPGGPGGHGGPGGFDGGNTDKGDHSTKGIKADNDIFINGGTVCVKSYDDAIHANSDAALENGETPTGNVTISGGTLELSSNDDGIHADGTLTVTGGKISVTNCYEGLEGNTVLISGGDISVISKDDGINSTSTSGVGITISGGKLYIYAGGDGIDANSRTSYQGIVFEGGDVTVISTSGGNSSIDTEQGYTYTGGKVLAVCPSGGMSSEAAKCRNFNSVGTKKTLSLKSGQILSVKADGKTELTVKMPCSLSALVIYLGASDASFTTE